MGCVRNHRGQVFVKLCAVNYLIETLFGSINEKKWGGKSKNSMTNYAKVASEKLAVTSEGKFYMLLFE